MLSALLLVKAWISQTQTQTETHTCTTAESENACGVCVLSSRGRKSKYSLWLLSQASGVSTCSKNFGKKLHRDVYECPLLPATFQLPLLAQCPRNIGHVARTSYDSCASFSLEPFSPFQGKPTQTPPILGLFVLHAPHARKPKPDNEPPCNPRPRSTAQRCPPASSRTSPTASGRPECVVGEGNPKGNRFKNASEHEESEENTFS